jgi:hypothetical protein
MACLQIITERDLLFTSNFWKEIIKLMGAQLNFTTTYHLQSDGQTERLNQCVKNYLRCMVFSKPKDCIRWLPLAEWWYNTNYHTAFKTTPFEALYGYRPPQLSLGVVPRSANQAANEMIQERQQTLRLLKENLLQAQNLLQVSVLDRRVVKKKTKRRHKFLLSGPI